MRCDETPEDEIIREEMRWSEIEKMRSVSWDRMVVRWGQEIKMKLDQMKGDSSLRWMKLDEIR